MSAHAPVDVALPGIPRPMNADVALLADRVVARPLPALDLF